MKKQNSRQKQKMIQEENNKEIETYMKKSNRRQRRERGKKKPLTSFGVCFENLGDQGFVLIILKYVNNLFNAM